MQRKIRGTVVVLVALFVSPLAAQVARATGTQDPTDATQAATPPGAPLSPYAFAWNPRTGDAWIDRHLTDINTYGDRYRGAFVDELVRYHAAPRALVVELIGTRHWAPGDVYYACAMAQMVGRPCRTVVSQWEQAHADGWRAMADSLDASGSDTRDRLMLGIRDSYVRWGRLLAEVEPVASDPTTGDAAAAGKRKNKKSGVKRTGK